MIDVVLLSHDEHADNLDTLGRRLIANVPVVLTTESGAARLGGNARGLAPWQITELQLNAHQRLTVMGTPARHGPEGSEAIVGEVTGFLLKWSSDSGESTKTIYISGDTVLFPALDGLKEYGAIDLGFLNFGDVHEAIVAESNLTLSAAEGATLSRDLQIHKIVPLHYEGWQHFREGRPGIEIEFARLGVFQRLEWLALGQTVPL